VEEEDEGDAPLGQQVRLHPAAGGAGIANAEGPTDSAGVAGVQPSPATVEPPTAGSPNGKKHTHRLFNVPKTRLGNSGSTPDGDPPTGGNGPSSRPGLISGIPKTITATLGPDAAAGASWPPPPTGVGRTPRSNSRPSAHATAGQAHAGPTAPDDATPDKLVHRLADNAAVTVGGDVQPRLRPHPRAADTTTQKLAPLPSTATTAPMSVPMQTRPALPHPVATMVSNVLSALGFSRSASNAGGSPTAPMPMLLGVLQLVRRELENIAVNHGSPMAQLTSAQTYVTPTITPGVPSPADQVPTAYGDIGKWMLESDGQISDYGGQLYSGKTLLEPVNVIIVDPTSKNSWQAAIKLNTAMFFAGFPAQPIHSTGFQGIIDATTYGQQPKGLIRGYSDNFFLFPNDHGRIFGPDPVQTSTGYVWSGAFSTEELGLYNGLPTHTYVSSDMARTALAMRLISSGQATYGGMVSLDNSYNTATTTTGDHDGYAVVLILK